MNILKIAVISIEEIADRKFLGKLFTVSCLLSIVYILLLWWRVLYLCGAVSFLQRYIVTLKTSCFIEEFF